VTLTVLSGGLTNFNYRAHLKDGDTSYVVRIFGRDAERVGVNRKTEERATRNAAELGIGPRLVGSAEEMDALVTEFLEGTEVSPDEFRSEEMIRRIAEVLRLLHRGPSLPTTLDPFQMIERYHRIAVESEISPPADYEWAHALASRVIDATGFSFSAACHGDLLPANFLDGERLYLVDYEYAGMSDPRGDLADLSAFNGFGEEEERHLVESYFGEVDERTYVAVRTLRFISLLRAGMWALAQSGISELDIDYRGWAAEQFDALRTLGAHEEFLQGLRELE
jgi:thiamine kinase-like enzyme